MTCGGKGSGEGGKGVSEVPLESIICRARQDVCWRRDLHIKRIMISIFRRACLLRGICGHLRIVKDKGGVQGALFCVCVSGGSEGEREGKRRVEEVLKLLSECG